MERILSGRALLVTTGKPLSSLGKCFVSILIYLLSPPPSLVGPLSLPGTVCPQVMHPLPCESAEWGHCFITHMFVMQEFSPLVPGERLGLYPVGNWYLCLVLNWQPFLAPRSGSWSHLFPSSALPDQLWVSTVSGLNFKVVLGTSSGVSVWRKAPRCWNTSLERTL